MREQRLDSFISEKYGLSREVAKEIIVEGRVTFKRAVCLKPGVKLREGEEALVEVLLPEERFVSRGGIKLLHALKDFEIDVSDKICIDIGASTGGFTECLLKHGARLVYAVDVGTNQLAERLRADQRVISIENTNIKTLPALPNLCEIATVDLSFISLTKVLGSIKAFITEDGLILALVKPQFEAGRKYLSSKGIVRDTAVHDEVIKNIKNFAQNINLSVLGVKKSHITGRDGNVEYFMLLRNS